MKKNDLVKYICTYRCADPHSHLIIGAEYKIEKVKVQGKHKTIKLYHKMGWFDSDCFVLLQNQLNNYHTYRSNMDPSDIKLESTSKMFEYEKLSREIETCNDVDTLKQMARSFVKLYLKHQEVAAQTMRMT